ncbi:MAG: nucleotidyltransferase domain-containing protein [Nitrospirae bacterium]|nr:nucleotidyltransferase domain-containing protein [Nitrospirota bacterium]
MNTGRKLTTPLEDILIAKLINRIELIEGAIALILFGSRVSGFSNEYSDLDIALIVKRPLLHYQLDKIKNEVMEEMDIVGELRIDLFSFTEDEVKHLPIGKEIEGKGVILWKKDLSSQRAL